MTVILALGLLLLGGYWCGRAARHFGLPAVTGYIFAGIVLGPHGLFDLVLSHGLIPTALISDRLAPITDLVLGVVALTIGGELRWGNLKKRGVGIATIAVLSSLGASVVIYAALRGLTGASQTMALLLAAIGSATAPAATVAVLREYRAKGPLTDTILAVVALDDAVALVLFAVAAAIVSVFGPSRATVDLLHLVGAPCLEIFGSILLGAAAGAALERMGAKIQQRGNLLAVAVGMTLVVGGTARALHMSALLANLAAGAYVANRSRTAVRIFGSLRDAEIPLYIAFFALAGAHLRFDLLGQAGLYGLVYVAARAAGKIAGAFGGCLFAPCSPQVKRWLGATLLPQAGVAIGLAFVATRFLSPADGDLLTTVILAAVAINEIVGPPLTKLAVVRCGEQSRAGASERDEGDQADGTDG